MNMMTSDLIRVACNKRNVTLSELARRIGQSRQNLYKKMKRDTLTVGELIEISNALEIKFEQSFTMPDGEKLTIKN